MSAAAVPEGPEHITSAWVSRVLKREVEISSLTRIGEEKGFTGGRLYRLTFRDGGALVAKLAPQGIKARQLSAASNQREVGFYRDLAGGLPVPGCWYAAVESETDHSCLLLDDLTASGCAEYQTGFTLGEARLAVTSLAACHARYWGDAKVDTLPLAGPTEGQWFEQAWPSYPSVLEALLPGHALPDVLTRLGDKIATDPMTFLRSLLVEGPVTLLHGDCQVDNVVFGPDATAILLDWQFAGRGRGIVDLAYMMISSLSVDLRRTCESELILAYRNGLALHGIAPPPLEVLWSDYKRAVAVKLFMTVGATTQLDNSSDSKRAWRRTDLHRLNAFALDHLQD